ncbi:MAG TPA: hypothetical protein DDW52_19995 [Planctomycetaceae bacterium]|nr:hypothetical protein [Planctomycetaceae bacterium]
MKLRRAISLSKQRLTRKAFRAALSLGAAGCLLSVSNAQELPALPDFPTQAVRPATTSPLPLPTTNDRAQSTVEPVTKARLVRFVGLKLGQPTATANSQSPTCSAETTCSIQAKCDKSAPDQTAKITWQARTAGQWKANPYVQATSNPASAVVPAAATTKVETGISDGGSREITVTVSGNGDSSDSLLDVDIPLSLPTMPAARQQAKTTKPMPRPSQVRAPEPVRSSTRMRLSDSTSSPASSQPKAPEQLGTLKQTARVTPSSRSDSASSKSPSIPETFNLSDRKSARAEKQSAQLPTLPAAKSTAKIPAPKLPELTAVSAGSKMEAVKLKDGSLPSTRSSRGQGAKKPMQVRIEGVPNQPVANKPSPTAPSLPQLANAPQPAKPSTRMSLSDQPKPSLKRIPASLASQRKPLPPASPAAPEALTSSSSRRSPDPASARPAEQTTKADLSVVVAQAVPLSVKSTIVQTSVEDPSVCQLIQSGERNLSLVGLKQGSTRVAIVTTDGDQEPKVRVYQVAVGRGDKAEYGLVELAEGIDQTVARLYPSSDIRVQTGDGKLIVSGTSSSEDEARRVLSLVRRTSLMPVVDKLETR